MPSFYRDFVRHVAFLFDAETMHKAALFAGQQAGKYKPLRDLFHSLYYHSDPALTVRLGHVTYPSPAGLAAGYDKYGQLFDIIPHTSAGHLEFGTITPSKRKGNPGTRCWRLPDDYAMINRMSLNNSGLVKSAETVKEREFEIPVHVNFDPNVFRVEDTQPDSDVENMVAAREILWDPPFPKVLNISCPNAEDGTAYEDPERLDALLGKVDIIRKRKPRPVYIKVSHDLANDQLLDILYVGEKHGVTGYILTNTSLSRNGLITSSRKIRKIGNGGLSGAPLMERNLEMVKLARKTLGDEEIIIGCGGIGCIEGLHPAFDTFRYLENGADMVQVLTGVPYWGPSIFGDIVTELPKYLEGYGSLEEFRKRRG
ncbi:MAG: hypothetical protein WC613_02805 [Candidatus Aenigmatarchaeota archaeon]